MGDDELPIESVKAKTGKALPPCRVCGQPAAGFHYGVNTCDACKGFFHRSLNLHQFYVCKHNETCQNKKGSKRMCRKCRYDRCVAAGMAKESIKTGRYPASKHTSNILELQKLKSLETPQCEEVETPTASCCNASGFSSRCLQNLDQCPSYLRLKKKDDGDSLFMIQCIDFLSKSGGGIQSLPDVKSRLQSAQNSFYPDIQSDSGTESSMSSTALCPSSSSTSSQALSDSSCFQPSPTQQQPSAPNSNSFPLTPTTPSNFSPTHNAFSSESDHGLCPSSLESHESWQGHGKEGCTSRYMELSSQDDSLNSFDNVPREECTSCGLPLITCRVEELYVDKDHISQVLMEARRKFLKPVSLQASAESIDRMAADHLETCKMKTEMFGQRVKVPDEEYDLIFASTGIDADNRKQRYETYLEFMEKLTRSVVKFSKTIPGFTQLSTLEKENLIKSGLGEVSYLNNYHNSRPESGVICGPDNNLRCILDSTLILDEADEIVEWFDCTVKLSRSLQRLCLTEEEETLINAIAIMAPDRGLFTPSQMARVIHEQLHECLIRHMRKTRTGDPLQLYAKIINSMVLARTVSHQYANVLRQINLPKYSLLQKNPLLREMMTGFAFGDCQELRPDG